MHGSAAVQFSDVKVNRVTKHIEVKFFITGAEFHDQIRSIAPIIPPYPHAGGYWGLQLLACYKTRNGNRNGMKRNKTIWSE